MSVNQTHATDIAIRGEKIKLALFNVGHFAGCLFTDAAKPPKVKGRYKQRFSAHLDELQAECEDLADMIEALRDKKGSFQFADMAKVEDA
jgi:Skp family chaperone for outer membrane proteins